MIEPRNEISCGADVVLCAEGHIVRCALASGERSTGVKERSMLAGVPQEPGRSRSLPSRQRRGRRLRKGPGWQRQIAICRSEQRSTRGTVRRRQRSQAGWRSRSRSLLIVPMKAGNQPDGTRWREGADRIEHSSGGTDGEDIEPRGHLNATTEDRGMGARR